MRPLHLSIKFSGLLLAVLFLATAPIHAEVSTRISEHERAVFSFFKLVKSAPDYPTWVVENSRYKKAATPAEKEVVYEHENLRLKWGFGTHDVQKNLLTISTSVLLQLQNNKEDGATLNFKFKQNYESLGKDKTGAEIPLFPYPYGKEWIALIINDLQKFVTVPLGKKQHQTIRTYFDINKIYEGTLKMQILPKRADNKKPLMIQDEAQWLMLGDTAYFQLSYDDPVTQENTVFWEYSAPWNEKVQDEDILLQLLVE